MERKTIVFELQWHEILKEYPKELRIEVYDAVFEYALDGTISDLTPLASVAFSFIKQSIDERVTERNTPEYREWRKKVLIRDDYTCQMCKKQNDKLEVHHIKPFALYTGLRLDIDNGITLCSECHKMIHHKEGYGER